MPKPELVLLPQPRRLTSLDGNHKLQPDRFILLVGDDRSAMLRIGQAVRGALAEMGADWELTTHGGDGQRIGAFVHVDPAQVVRPQGYVLTTTPDQIRIVAHDTAGAFYGAMTLGQIVRQSSEGALPCLRIEDWPDIANRGVMLDISRDRVPTMATLCQLVDMFAEWKMNQLQLYTEHTFAYRNHREVWADWSPMTGEQVLELDAYCRERFIELVPNQNTFGHLARWMQHSRYQHLCEYSNPGELNPHQGVFGTLCPTDPGSIELVREMLDELLPHFASGQVNVGCDEARIGADRTRDIVEERGKGRVYLDYMLKVHELVQQRGRTMQFWGDAIMHHPELAEQMPEGGIPIMYDYAADAPFDKYNAAAAEAGVPFYVSPGTNCWSTIIGNTATAVANIRRAAESAVRYGAIGYLNTDWGDNGHWQHLPVSFAGYAYGAAMSWAVEANKDVDLPRALDVHCFGDSAGVMGKLVCELGDVSRCHEKLFGTHGPMPAWILIGLPGMVEQLSGLTSDVLNDADERLKQTMSALSAARMARPDAALIADELRNNADLFSHALHLWAARIETHGTEVAKRTLASKAEIWPRRSIDDEYAALPPKTRAGLADELAPLLDDYRHLWLTRNRPGGLHDSAGRFENVLNAYRAK